ncbi:hypothetical protein [Methyloceanibacter caenitepidi]|uniref:Uncharacterized protein n=1 Tax=Methyloceanibacter caenitepidi TaxID=1384459 RepID=A0A0A8K6F7_9HYPH|nr:hypothetical protein [Methyloceanibacter caenitepidi]BAQ18346.1 hypothetical protein GL4_2913 [Methyloceanibacter caenitepidi]
MLREIEAYTKAKGMAESTFGRLAANDGKLVDSLRGGSTVTLKTLRKIQAYIEGNPIKVVGEPVVEASSE